jgi:hypothetical protein
MDLITYLKFINSIYGLDVTKKKIKINNENNDYKLKDIFPIQKLIVLTGMFYYFG